MEESIKYPSIVFNIAELHQKYWKEFCDAYYSSFGFVTSENSTYEQKYETFCRLKEWSEKGKGYKEEHLEVNSFDFRFLKKLEERLYSLKDKEELISTLYYYVRTIRSIRRKIGIKNWTIKNIRPDIIYIEDYSKYLLDETKHFESQDEYWPTIRDVLKNPTNEAMLKEMMGEDCFFNYTFDSLKTDILDSGDIIEYNPADGNAISLVNIILEDEIPSYNRELRELMTLLPERSNCPIGEEQKLFLYRLFMTYKDSLAEIKNMLEELPCPLNLSRLKKEYDNLIFIFKTSTLGSQWIQCMEHKDGIKYMAKYFMNHRYNYKFEGNQFFLMLDKICIIEDILKGNACRYGLEIEYPKGWFATEEKDRKNSIKEEEVSSFAQSNIIFNPKIFTNEQQYAQLRKIILSFIEQKKENVEKEEFQINPQIQAEWYFIKRAILEAEVTNRDNLTNPKFLRQMQAWFPACFKIGKDEKEEKKIIKQYGESISRERKKWVNGTEKKEVPIEHMIEHGKSRKYVKANTLSRYNVLKKLKKKLKDFKDNNN
ncbi:MAG TPA: hypothetical protein PL178_04595 [Prevotella sp.]|jgi:hypothetical protein|nr:hypothetical protein [Prevotella sp.]HRN21480.1 hypothetical protein [Prevotella sp.]